MALTPRLELRQGQTLVMTPQLQQAIKLLQLSNLELQSYVEEQLEQNPLLEVDDRPKDGGSERQETASEATEAAPGPEGDRSSSDADLKRAEDGDMSTVSDLDTDYDNIYTDDSAADRMAAAEVGNGSQDWSTAGKSGGSFNDEGGDFEANLTPEISLRDHLTEQLQIAIRDPQLRLIGADLIDSVDEAGYLTADLDNVAERIGAERDQVDEVLEIVQGFDPTGVCARGLKECLALQLKEIDRLDPYMVKLLENLELLGKQDFAGLQKICGVDQEDLADMLADLRKLNPKPGLVFSSEVAQPVVPDVFVYAKSDGSWHVELNTDTLPRVLVNMRYYSEISKVTKGKADDKAYVTDCLNQANWLVKSLDQRARTILKVSTEIVRQQDGFFAHGVRHLRPLNLRTIAEAISMHESTVSRVTSNKFMATPRGVFELKYFFTSAIASTAGGEAHSAESVRARIKDLVDNEAPNAVLSDDRIVELLREEGVDIARRTVAKYRESMRIPSSVQRRRLKKMSA